jgi:hypothetical protein
MSSIHVDPDLAVELFVLEAMPEVEELVPSAAEANGGRDLRMDEPGARPLSQVGGTGLSDAALSSRKVSFLGPPLTRQTRVSLSAAEITMIERRRGPAWDGQIQQYLVSVAARDGEDALARVMAALESHASFSAFRACRAVRH